MNSKESNNSRLLVIVGLLSGSVLLCACVAVLAIFLFGARTSLAGPLLGGPEIVQTEPNLGETLGLVTRVPEEAAPQVTEIEEAPDVSAPPVTEDEPAEAMPDQPAESPSSEVAAPDSEKNNVAPAATLTEEDLAVLQEVWGLLRDQYDGDVPADAALLYAAIAGSLETLDDENTRFIPPDVAERLREDMQGSFQGIGAFVRENDEGFFEIVRPIDGQPADLAGLQAGDLIVGVDGDSIIGRSLDETITLVRGPEGSQVILTVRREGVDDFDLTIIRARIEIPVIEAELLDDDIVYIRLTTFLNPNAEAQLLEAFNTLAPANPRGLILDLRDNGGGFLNQATAIADQFLDGGVILFERNVRGLDRTFSAESGQPLETIPLIILVNAGSASASEIVAGAVQDNGRGILIGETTFGKGSVQQPNVLSDGSELRVTIARWYTPNNETIDGQGITPDIEVATPEDLGGEGDTQLQRAIEYLLTGE